MDTAHCPYGQWAAIFRQSIFLKVDAANAEGGAAVKKNAIVRIISDAASLNVGVYGSLSVPMSIPPVPS